MDAPAGHTLSRATRQRQWILVALLVTAGVVNYLDRSTLAIANHDISSEMRLSPGQMGLLLSAFAWAYSAAQLPAGLLTDRLGARIVLAGAMTVWSSAQMICGGVSTFGQFIVARVGLGLGESPLFTSGARATVDWFPIRDRGVPLGLFNSASSLGPALAPPLLTALMLAFGWRSMFVAMGAAGLLVALAWWLYYRDPTETLVSADDIAAIQAGDFASEAKAGPAIWKAFFLIPSTWALIGGQFGTVYVTWLYVAWLPDYLESVRHVSVAQTGVFAAIPQFAGFVGGVIGGFLSDGLAHRKLDPVLSRKIPAATGLAIAALLTALAPLSSNTGVVLAVMSGAMFFAYGSGSCSWALGATLTPPRFVATLESIQNVGGSFGGALAPLVTGLVVQFTHGFGPAFALAASASLAGAVSLWLVRADAYEGIGEPV
jgi:MFS family permease